MKLAREFAVSMMIDRDGNDFSGGFGPNDREAPVFFPAFFGTWAHPSRVKV